MASLLIKDVSIAFPLYHGESRSLKKTVFAAASGRLGEDRKKRLVVEAPARPRCCARWPASMSLQPARSRSTASSPPCSIPGRG
jgi:hypothetical protein